MGPTDVLVMGLYFCRIDCFERDSGRLVLGLQLVWYNAKGLVMGPFEFKFSKNTDKTD